MNTLIKRVTQDKFEKEIEDYTVAGWALKSRSDRFATMEKHGGYGQPVVHIIIFIFFGWWNFLLGNLIYAVYSYMSGTQALHIRVDDTVNTTSPAARLSPPIPFLTVSRSQSSRGSGGTTWGHLILSRSS